MRKLNQTILYSLAGMTLAAGLMAQEKSAVLHPEMTVADDA